MTVSISGVHVLVDDPDAALAFYRDTLGMTVRGEVTQGGFRWITLVTESQPEIQIVLSQPHSGHAPSSRPRKRRPTHDWTRERPAPGSWPVQRCSRAEPRATNPGTRQA